MASKTQREKDNRRKAAESAGKSEPSFETDAQLQVITEQMPEVQERVATLQVEDAEAQAIAINIAGSIKRGLKIVEEKRKEFSVPLNKMLKLLNDKARTVREPLEQMEKALKGKLGIYQEKVEALQREAEAKRQEEIRKADAKRRQEEDAKREKEEELQRKIRQEADEKEREKLEAKLERSQDKPVEQHAPPPPPEPEIAKTNVKSNGAAATFKKVPKFQVFAPKAVPRDFLMVDEKKIRAAVNNGTTEIAGVRIWIETNTSIKPK